MEGNRLNSTSTVLNPFSSLTKDSPSLTEFLLALPATGPRNTAGKCTPPSRCKPCSDARSPSRVSSPSQLLPYLILQVPDTVLVGELLVAGATFGQNTALKTTHVKQQIGVVLAVNGDEAVLPLYCGD